ncbi:PQQ-binding-like beta-propeller repeat protein [Sphingomonas sp.]|uniref:outer membrane protein assembly factor BamB family protein n=1 Tax=Sphingomonas sp. TaxID=28214 RepID=UPI0025D7CBB3|nr:PQQ-binding-like beta-propeller repeat protein [Sphingomonas sp.]
MNKTNRSALVLAPVLGLALALGGCGVFKASKPKSVLTGDRIPILTSENGVEVEPALAGVAVTLPAAAPNDSWSQPGGNATKSMGHLALGANIAQAWEARVAGSTKGSRLAATPVVAGGKLYVMDTEAQITAFNAATGAKSWSVNFGDDGVQAPAVVAPVVVDADSNGKKDKKKKNKKKSNKTSLFGGGVSVDGDILYATNGLGDIGALKIADGSVIWKKRLSAPLRGAPSVALGNIYAMSQDNQMFAVRATDGNVEWTEAAAVSVAGVFGVAAPAIGQGTVVSGFSSGDLTAYRYENGRSVWQDTLSRTSINTSVGTLTDIDADPVIDQGRVFAIGLGGRMVSLELVTGQRIWELNIAGLSTPWVAGEWVFVITDDAKLLCVARATGKIRWVSQLQRYRKDKAKNGSVTWTGPVLAGDRLVLANSSGDMVTVSPGDGKTLGTTKIGQPVFLQPIVANSTLYIFDNSGRITAFR